MFAAKKEPTFHRRIVNTLLLLLLFRLLANIPLANVDEEKMHELLKNNPLLGAVDLFAGGEVLTSFSIVAVGLFPFLFATGLVQLAARLIPAFRALEKDTEEERFKLYTKIVTVPLAFVLAWGITRYLALDTGLFPVRLKWFNSSTFLSTLLVVSVVTFGSWLTGKIKDWISTHGIGLGESVILLMGSSLTFTHQLSDLIFSGRDAGTLLRQLAIHAVVGLGVILLSAPILRKMRRIPINIPRPPPRRMGFQPASTAASELPLLLSRGGTTPISSAVGFLVLFQIAAMFLGWAFPGKFGALQNGLEALANQASGIYWALLAAMVVAFTYLTNFTLLWKPFKDSDLSVSEHLRRTAGSYIPGVRPGDRTDAYLSGVMARITLPAALVLAILAAGLPYLILKLTGENTSVAILSLTVFVKASLDVYDRCEAYHTLDTGYDGLLKRGRIRKS